MVFVQHVDLILILVIFSSAGFLKDKVYNNKPRTKEPKENIHTEIANISIEQLQRINQNLFRWCEESLSVVGQHFQRPLYSVNKGKNFPSFRTLSVVRQADSLANSYTPRSKRCTSRRKAQSSGTGQQSKNPPCISVRRIRNPALRECPKWAQYTSVPKLSNLFQILHKSMKEPPLFDSSSS
jgi:hypothetical protein